MNISKTAKAFAIAAVVGLTSQVFGATTNTWWNQNFNDVADMTALTNVSYSVVAGGQWSTVGDDESSIVNTNGSPCIKLDTQGSNLTWTPASASTSVVVLVDAAIYLVGSDSPPSGFDPLEDVQTAVYLTNRVDEVTGATIGSALCAYVAPLGANTWVELEGVAVTNENWYNVRIEVDYAAESPEASFYVNGVLMSQKGGSATSFLIANTAKFQSEGAKKVNSVSFRGTGAVDNFVGSQVLPDPGAQLTFTVETYTDNVLDGSANTVNGSGLTVAQGTQFWVVFNEVDAGETKYLTAVRVYTNETQYVHYDVNYDDPDWTLVTPPLTYDNSYFGIRLDIDTSTLTEGYLIKAYYGADPSGGGNPDPVIDPVIQPVTGQPAVAFEIIESVEYFAVSFLAPEAGIVYSLQTQTALGGSWTDETDPLATDTSSAANEEITLKAPTGGATTKFFRVKASTAQ